MSDQKEYMKKYNKAYYAKNAEKIKASHKVLVKCDVCNKDIKKAFWARHQRTKKHMDMKNVLSRHEEISDRQAAKALSILLSRDKDMEKAITRAVRKALRNKMDINN